MLAFTLEDDDQELRQLASSVRGFVDKEIDALAEDKGFDPALFEKLKTLGLFGMATSEPHGGTEIPYLGISATIFELARKQLSPAIYLSVHLMVARLIERWSSENEKGELLTRLASGERFAAFCLTEASAGSDAAAIKTQAKQSDDSYLINGEKIYITSGGVADTYLVFARTSDDGSKGISAFIIDKETEGVSFGPAEEKMGCSAAPIRSVTFTNCSVPLSSRLGNEGDGYKIALSGLNGGRANIAAAACGLAAEACARAKEFALERKQFGSPIAEFQGIQFMLANMVMKLQASILLSREAAKELDKGKSSNVPASIAKCFSSDSAMEITTEAVQIFGGAGYLQEYGVEKLMRNAKMLQIVEGTNQIQRIVIARELLKT